MELRSAGKNEDPGNNKCVGKLKRQSLFPLIKKNLETGCLKQKI